MNGKKIQFHSRRLSIFTWDPFSLSAYTSVWMKTFARHREQYDIIWLYAVIISVELQDNIVYVPPLSVIHLIYLSPAIEFQSIELRLFL